MSGMQAVFIGYFDNYGASALRKKVGAAWRDATFSAEALGGGIVRLRARRGDGDQREHQFIPGAGNVAVAATSVAEAMGTFLKLLM